MNASFAPTRRGVLNALFATQMMFAAVFVGACAEKKNEVPEKHYKMTGEVVGLNAKDQTATIKHGPIENWMEAMTMDYPIRSKAEFDQLHVGDHITATVAVRGTDYDLIQVQKQNTQK
jgi:Cu/Ag efflux protein CusF